MLKNIAIDLLVEGHDFHEHYHVITEGVQDDFIVIPSLLVEGDIEAAYKKLKREGKDLPGWTRENILKKVDPRFINHAEHFEKLMHGGVDANGDKFPGGGGLRWGGLVVKGGEALLRVMGSFEYNNVQEIYQQTIRFANFGKIARMKGLTWSEKARLLLKDKMLVHCDCPAFRYYYAYTAYKKGYGLYPEIRPAKINNPGNKGSVCKHMNVTLRWLGGQYQKIAQEMKQYASR